MSTSVPRYVSEASANAVISEHRPIQVSPSTLLHINMLVDELVSSIITAASSFNPKDIRLVGVPAVFSGDKHAGESTGPRALARAAVNEAEVELRSWYAGHPVPRGGRWPPDGEGRGLTVDQERSGAKFPISEALEYIRVNGPRFCTLAADEHPEDDEERAVQVWAKAGGDASDETLEVVGMYIFTMLDYLIEHILSQLGTVIQRDSSISVATDQHLYTALCEDESVWGVFKRMKLKPIVEAAAETSRQRRSQPPGQSGHSPSSGSPHASKTSLVTGNSREASFDAGRRGPTSAFDSRPSLEHGRVTGLGTPRKAGSINKKGFFGTNHERSNSVLSVNTRSMLGAYNEQVEEEVPSPKEQEEEFDALLRSSQTMKVSLTPSRLKTFEATGRKGPGSPTQSVFPRTTISEEHPPPAPRANSSPARNGTNVRPGSAGRLLARGATTIAERDEEEPPGRGGKTETLMDILASEGPWEEAQRARSGSASRRTVPAVVLGTPPPPAPAAPREAIPSLNRPQGRKTSDADDEFGIPRHKKKTSAQELADFLNSTPPPPTPPSRSASTLIADDASVKSKGFKGFMSKVTGSGGKKESPKRQSASRLQDIPTADRDLVAAKRKQPMASSVSSNPPSSFRGSIDAPSLPTKGILRKKSDARETTAAPSVATTAVAAAAVGAGVGATAGAVAATSKPPRRPSVGKTSAVEAGSCDPVEPAKTCLQVQPTALAKTEDEYIGPSPVEPAKPSPPETAALAAPLTAETATTKGTGHEVSPSDAVSFKTADEEVGWEQQSKAAGDVADGETVDPDEPVKIVAEESAEPAVEPKEDTQEVEVPAEEPILSIPLQDLLPLRHLLDHATTVRECQLLLSAILTQWGVPLLAADTSPEPSPEDRVAAWLLAGREGPVVVSPTGSSFSKAETEVRTPIGTPEGRMKELKEVGVETRKLELEGRNEIEEEEEEEELMPEVEGRRVGVREY